MPPLNAAPRPRFRMDGVCACFCACFCAYGWWMSVMHAWDVSVKPRGSIAAALRFLCVVVDGVVDGGYEAADGMGCINAKKNETFIYEKCVNSACKHLISAT